MTDSTISTNLAAAQAAQIATITAACAAAIVGGFTSSALGSPYAYPSALTDQQNLSDALLSFSINWSENWSMSIWCVSARGGVWEKVPHNIGQLKMAAWDGIKARQAHRALKDKLSAQISAAQTVEAIQAVVWPVSAGGAVGA